MESLLKILSELKPGVNFTSSKNIVDEGLLNSMELVRLVTELNDEFDIEIKVSDLKPENFRTVDTIFALIKRLEE